MTKKGGNLSRFRLPVRAPTTDGRGRFPFLFSLLGLTWARQVNITVDWDYDNEVRPSSCDAMMMVFIGTCFFLQSRFGFALFLNNAGAGFPCPGES